MVGLSDIFDLRMLTKRRAAPRYNPTISASASALKEIKHCQIVQGHHPALVYPEAEMGQARINMDLGLLYKLKRQPGRARTFLEIARAPAELQGATSLVGKIDAALAELPQKPRKRLGNGAHQAWFQA